jgi:predicted ATPase
MGITSTHQGHFRLALEHFERALSLYNADRDRNDPFVDVLNPGVAMRCFTGWCLWFIGHPDRALVPIQEAVTLARQLSEPHGLAHALGFAAVLHQLRRERSIARHYADAAIALTAEHGLVLYEAVARIVRGWALIGGGDDEYAATQIRQGLAGWQSTGAQLMRPHFLALLAEAVPPTSQDDPGLRVLDEALALAESTGERWCQAEVYRLRGERLLITARERANVGEAEACFEQSLATAREQEALSVELRTAMSLARLHRDRAGHAQARDALLAVYQRFAEGFDTHDLREALGLLARRLEVPTWPHRAAAALGRLVAVCVELSAPGSEQQRVFRSDARNACVTLHRGAAHTRGGAVEGLARYVPAKSNALTSVGPSASALG